MKLNFFKINWLCILLVCTYTSVCIGDASALAPRAAGNRDGSQPKATPVPPANPEPSPGPEGSDDGAVESCLMGSWEITSKVRIVALGSDEYVMFKARPVKGGREKGAEKRFRLVVTKTLNHDDVCAMLDSLPKTNNPFIHEIITYYKGHCKDKEFYAVDTKGEILGLGLADKTVISDKLARYPLALFHEIAHSAITDPLATNITLERVVDELTIGASDYTQAMTDPKKRRLKDHYVLRALQREHWPGLDRALSFKIWTMTWRRRKVQRSYLEGRAKIEEDNRLLRDEMAGEVFGIGRLTGYDEKQEKAFKEQLLSDLMKAMIAHYVDWAGDIQRLRFVFMKKGESIVEVFQDNGFFDHDSKHFLELVNYYDAGYISAEDRGACLANFTHYLKNLIDQASEGKVVYRDSPPSFLRVKTYLAFKGINDLLREFIKECLGVILLRLSLPTLVAVLIAAQGMGLVEFVLGFTLTYLVIAKLIKYDSKITEIGFIKELFNRHNIYRINLYENIIGYKKPEWKEQRKSFTDRFEALVADAEARHKEEKGRGYHSPERRCLRRALKLARDAYDGNYVYVFGKRTTRYEHLLDTVQFMIEELNETNPYTLSVTLLHDIAEDTEHTNLWEKRKKRFPERMRSAIDLLNKKVYERDLAEETAYERIAGHRQEVEEVRGRGEVSKAALRKRFEKFFSGKLSNFTEEEKLRYDHQYYQALVAKGTPEIWRIIFASFAAKIRSPIKLFEEDEGTKPTASGTPYVIRTLRSAKQVFMPLVVRALDEERDGDGIDYQAKLTEAIDELEAFLRGIEIPDEDIDRINLPPPEPEVSPEPDATGGSALAVRAMGSKTFDDLLEFDNEFPIKDWYRKPVIGRAGFTMRPWLVEILKEIKQSLSAKGVEVVNNGHPLHNIIIESIANAIDVVFDAIDNGELAKEEASIHVTFRINIQSKKFYYAITDNGMGITKNKMLRFVNQNISTTRPDSEEELFIGCAGKGVVKETISRVCQNNYSIRIQSRHKEDGAKEFVLTADMDKATINDDIERGEIGTTFIIEGTLNAFRDGSQPEATPVPEADSISGQRIWLLREFMKEWPNENIIGLIVFGSVAKGTATEDSDLDYMVVKKTSFLTPDPENTKLHSALQERFSYIKHMPAVIMLEAEGNESEAEMSAFDIVIDQKFLSPALRGVQFLNYRGPDTVSLADTWLAVAGSPEAEQNVTSIIQEAIKTREAYYRAIEEPALDPTGNSL